jgi:release factor glutamine methyltransferase
MKLSQIIGKAYLSFAYKVYYKQRLGRTDHTRLFGFSLTIPPGVFHPGLFLSTKVFARYLEKRNLQGMSVLEMGCGSGLLSFIAARKGARVTSVDINPLAVGTTRKNAAANGLQEHVEVLRSDLFTEIPSGKRFDLILWNPPFYPKDPSDMPDRALNAGRDYEVVRRFAAESGKYLEPAGSVEILLRAGSNEEGAIPGFFSHEGMVWKAVYKRKTFFEGFTIHRFQKRETA